MFFYRSVEDLKASIADNYVKFSDFDVIVGIPRSGIIPATLLSLYLNKPLSTPELIAEGRFLSGGFRIEVGERAMQNSPYSKILVVDDSCESGAQLETVREKLSVLGSNVTVKYLAIYTHVNSKNLIDYTLEDIPLPRVFEWNILNHLMLKYSCVDIDGVLCPDPTDRENDDSSNYLDFVKNTKCLIKPKYKIHSLVTSRLEKYRTETIKWLDNNQIKYDHLIMSPHATALERRKANDHAVRKAQFYKESGNKLFIESDLTQAKEIFALTNMPVFCVETRKYFDPRSKDEIEILMKKRTADMKLTAWQKMKSLIKSGIGWQ